MSKEIDKLEVLADVCKEYDVSFSGVESNAIISAMDKWHEVVNKNDLLPDVSNRRELLIAFMQLREGHAVDTNDIHLIDEFLKGN